MALGLWTLWSTLAAVATSMALGFVWYGPVFGKKYLAAVGMADLSPEQLKAEQKSAGPGYGVSMATVAISAVVIAYLFEWSFPASGYTDQWIFGISLGTAGFLAFYLPGTFTNLWFLRGKPNFALWLITAGYWGLMAVLTGLYTGLFHPGLPAA